MVYWKHTDLYHLYIQMLKSVCYMNFVYVCLCVYTCMCVFCVCVLVCVCMCVFGYTLWLYHICMSLVLYVSHWVCIVWPAYGRVLCEYLLCAHGGRSTLFQLSFGSWVRTNFKLFFIAWSPVILHIPSKTSRCTPSTNLSMLSASNNISNVAELYYYYLLKFCWSS